MTTDFRALCAELVQAFEDLRDSSHGVFGLHLNGDLAPWDELIEGGRFEDWLEVFARARAALAKPADAPAAVAERPSDEELRDLWSWAAGQDQGPWPTQYHCFARAVLARWGNPAPQPVPVSERPWEREGWCAEDGRCWVWNKGSCEWWELVDSKLISYSSEDYTHCLPAHALPIPHQQENAND